MQKMVNYYAIRSRSNEMKGTNARLLELLCKNTALFFEFSLCLSRACLGKLIIFI